MNDQVTVQRKVNDKGNEDENETKQKVERRKLEIKTIIDNMRYMQNNIADRKTQNYVQLVQEKELVDFFLNKFEFEEMQRNYNDYNLGDFLLIFPNPDKPDYLKAFPKPGFTRFSEAEAVYDNYLRVLSKDGFTKQQLIQEKKAFLYAFLMLDDFDVKNEKTPVSVVNN